MARERIVRSIIRFFLDLDGFFFSLRLTLLNLRYGRGNIPANKLPSVFKFSSSHEEIEFRRTVTAIHCLQQITDQYRLAWDQCVVPKGFLRYIRYELNSSEEEEDYRRAIHSYYPACYLFEMMVLAGDIPPHKLNFYSHPEPFESREDWLKSLTANRDHVSQVAT